MKWQSGMGGKGLEGKNVFLQKKYVIAILAIFCNMLWGSAFPFIKIGYGLFGIDSEDVFSQILFAGSRFTLAGVMTIMIGSIQNRKLLVIHSGEGRKIVILSLFQTVIQYFFFYIGLANTSGVKASIIEASSVFMAILISALIFRMEQRGAAKLLACIPGFIGVILINVSGSGGLSLSMKWNGEGFILISSLSYAISTVLMKRFSKDSNPVLLSGYQFILGGFVMIICGILGHGQLSVTGPFAIAVLVYLAFVSSAAYSIWGILMKYNPVSEVAIYGFTNPVFGVLLSGLLLHEQLQIPVWQVILALALVCTGIFVVNYEKKPFKQGG